MRFIQMSFFCVVLLALALSASAQDSREPLATTTPAIADNVAFYVNLTISQNRADFRVGECQIDSTTKHHEAQININWYFSKLLDQEYKDFDNELNRIAILQMDYTCVAKFKAQLLPLAPLQARMRTCVTNTINRSRDLTNAAVASLNAAKIQGDDGVRAEANYCLRNEATNMQSCTETRTTARYQNVQTEIHNVERNCDAARCRSNQLNLEGIECSLQVLSEFNKNAGYIKASIENCINWDKHNSVGCHIEVKPAEPEA